MITSLLYSFIFQIFYFQYVFVITEIYAIIQDIKTYKTTTVPDDYSIYHNISTTLSKWQSCFFKIYSFVKNICLKIWDYFTENVGSDKF